MMFIGGLIVALTIEYCNLHKRIALRVLLLVGASPRWLMFGFMATTAFLSMWISNTATTAMMVPIVEAVVTELFPQTNLGSNAEDASLSTSSSMSTVEAEKVDATEKLEDEKAVAHKDFDAEAEAKNNKRCQTLRVGMLLSVAYASNVGGTGSIIGSSPQLAFKQIFDSKFPDAYGVNFASWMAFNVPGMIINVLVAWLWLQFLYIGFRKDPNAEARESQVRKMIRQRYADLGPITFHEIATLFCFCVVVLLWFFRDPQFIPGWSELITNVHVDDATAAMIIVTVLFIIPAKPNFWPFRHHETGPRKPSEALITWPYIQAKLPWDIVLLLGGGFALSDASEKSGLSLWLGEQLAGLQSLPPFLIIFIICVMTATITEVASNTATANILLPILAELSLRIEVNPVYLMMPAAVTCSYAFMLPVATPPNAIVFGASGMKPIELIKAGFLMNLVCVVVICVMMQFYGDVLFDIYTFPDWAQNITTTPAPECIPPTPPTIF